MARDLISIPITTVTYESSFSTRKKTITPYRSHLLPENVEAMLCIKTKTSQLDLYLEKPRLSKKKFKVGSSLLVERDLQLVSRALFKGTGSHEHSNNHFCF